MPPQALAHLLARPEVAQPGPARQVHRVDRVADRLHAEARPGLGPEPSALEKQARGARHRALAHRVLVPLSGRVDLALANGGGHDWDIVASDCILGEAGAELLTIHGKRPEYRLDGGEHPPLIAGSKVLFEKIRASLLTDTA